MKRIFTVSGFRKTHLNSGNFELPVQIGRQQTTFYLMNRFLCFISDISETNPYQNDTLNMNAGNSRFAMNSVPKAIAADADNNLGRPLALFPVSCRYDSDFGPYYQLFRPAHVLNFYVFFMVISYHWLI